MPDLHHLRNIGVIAHIDAGKTTVTERMLFFSGFSHRVGEVDKGTTVTDFDPEEQERGITINAASVNFPWKDVEINLIDTPGHVDFTAEVERSLRVLDGGVVVFSAREGVEAQSETVWHQADKYRVPRIAFINKMDREGADFFGTLDEIRERLHCHPIPVNLPIGAGPPHVKEAFRGLIDLIAMQMLTFDSQSKGAEVVASDIPPELHDEADLWRSQMLDQLSMFSDELTELLLAEEPVPAELIRKTLRDATIHNMAVPLLCGSALDGIGVQPVLDAVAAYLPSPADVPAVEGHDPKKPETKLVRHPSPDEPFCGLVFKIQADRHGDLHYVRVYSGVMKANSRVLNPGKDKKENVPQLWRVQADRRTQVESASAGDIIGVIGLRHSITGDTLCSTQNPILLESITFPETVISMAIEPETSTERKKLADVLEMMKRQDPTFRAAKTRKPGKRSSAAWANCIWKSSNTACSAISSSMSAFTNRASATAKRSSGPSTSSASATATSAGKCSRPSSASAWNRSTRAAKKRGLAPSCDLMPLPKRLPARCLSPFFRIPSLLSLRSPPALPCPKSILRPPWKCSARRAKAAGCSASL